MLSSVSGICGEQMSEAEGTGILQRAEKQKKSSRLCIYAHNRLLFWQFYFAAAAKLRPCQLVGLCFSSQQSFDAPGIEEHSIYFLPAKQCVSAGSDSGATAI